MVIQRDKKGRIIKVIKEPTEDLNSESILSGDLTEKNATGFDLDNSDDDSIDKLKSQIQQLKKDIDFILDILEESVRYLVGNGSIVMKVENYKEGRKK